MRAYGSTKRATLSYSLAGIRLPPRTEHSMGLVFPIVVGT